MLRLDARRDLVGRRRGEYASATKKRKGEILDALERHGELRLPEPARSRLAGMSAATADRLLKRHRASHPRAVSATRPGGLLESQVAVRRGTEWDDDRPGFVEVDTVAHCGGALRGEFLWTLTLTDVATGWTELAALRSKGRAETPAKLKGLRARLPFPLLGLDSDNGSEFLNRRMARFCEEEGVVFTRYRPYVKNDQCRVEQKSRSVVRRHAGYGRYDAPAQLALLAKIHGLLRFLVNFYEPSLKGKERAATPYRRLLASGTLDEAKADEMAAAHAALNPAALNPAALRSELDRAKMELYGMVSFSSEDDEETRSGN